MTIFGRGLCPLQPSLPALTIRCQGAAAQLLSSHRLSLLLLLLHLLTLCSLCPLSFLFLLVSPTHPVTAPFCLFSPNPVLPLILLLPASPSFTVSLCSFAPDYFLCCPFLPYPFLAGSCAHPGLCTPELSVLASGLFRPHPRCWNQPPPPGAHVFC